MDIFINEKSNKQKVGQEFYADWMQVSRIVWLVYVAHLLAQIASIPRCGHSSQREVRRSC